MTNIVKNDSKAYGYNYASLSDIAKQGYEIPKMKTISEDGNDYVCYYDKELNEWIRGAKVVVPTLKGQNEAQAYGSALTYARRYTCHLYLQIACDDDKELETNEPAKATQKQIEYIVKLYNAPNVAKILQYYQVENLAELTISQATEIIDKAKQRNEELKKK